MEIPSMAPALAFAFLAVGAMTLANIATDTLFVSAFGLGHISRFYIVTALTRVTAAFTLTDLNSTQTVALVAQIPDHIDVMRIISSYVIIRVRLLASLSVSVAQL